VAPTGLTLDIIVRVSKRGARDRLNSPGQQERDCMAWIKDNGHIYGTTHTAIDESAGHGSHPAIEAAKQRALDGESDGCVSSYLSRSFRHVVYGLTTVKELLDAGKHFYSLDCPFDLRTREGEKFFTDKLGQAQYEWRMYKDNFDRNVREAIERGVHIHIPFGYRRSDGQGTPLALDDKEWPTVRHAAECRADGWSWPRIARELNESWCPPRPTTRKLKGESAATTWQAEWNHTTVHQMLKQEVYRGYAYSGQYVNKAAHPAIIPDDLWHRIQATRGVKHDRPAEGYELSGLVRCSGCGYAMVHSIERTRRYYRCKRRNGNGDHRCPAPVNIPAAQLEHEVMVQFTRDHLSERAIGEATSEDETQARTELDAANSHMQSVVDTWARVREVRGKLSATQAEQETTAIGTAGDRVDRAEQELHRVLSTNRGHTLLGALTAEKFIASPPDERRLYLSLVYRAVVCYSGARRVPITDRFRIMSAMPEAANNGIPLVRAVLNLDK
jgi:hypothetical protein